MESLNYQSFITSVPPFDLLNSVEVEQLLKGVDIIYFRANEYLDMSEYLYIIAKGVIEGSFDENISYYSIKDSLSLSHILDKNLKNSFKTIEESILFGIKRETFLDIFNSNREFKNYLLLDITKKLDIAIKQNSSSELSSFMLSKVSDGFFHKPYFVDSKISIFEAISGMAGAKSIFIRFDDNSIGIVTDSDIRNRVILKKLDFEVAVGTIATKNIISIDIDDYLFNALLLMTEYSIKHLAIIKNGEIMGVMEQLDLLSSISNKSHLINIKIAKAKTIEELKEASSDLVDIIKVFQAKGVKVRHITKLISELHSKIYSKLYQLIAPKELIENSTLLVLGSEGRKEQTLITDQDNAIVLRDGFKLENLQTVTERFTTALIDFGFPKCEGGVMVNNPYWCKSLTEYKDEIYKLINFPNENSYLNLAIIFDGRDICGDKNIVLELKNEIFKYSNDKGFLTNFAKATLAFETPLSIFANFIVSKKEHKNELDIKKGGIFPIVHGIRTLTIEKKLQTTNTVERIKELNNLGVFDREMANELIEAFNFLLTLRLKDQLKKRDIGVKIDNYINPKELSKLEQDLLRDVFKIVDKFKKFISFHFRLNMVS